MRFFNYVFSLVFLCTLACSSGGSSSPKEPVYWDPTFQSRAEIALAQAYDDLKVHDLVSAQSQYCDTLVLEPADVNLAFGCGLVKLMRSVEQQQAADILTAFNQAPVSVENDILGPNGVINSYKALKNNNSAYTFNYSDFNLPFANNITQHAGDANGLLASILKPLIDKNMSVAQVQDLLKSFQPYFIDVEDNFNIAITDANLNFAIPKELFNTSEDLHAKQGDAYAMLSATQAIVAGIDMFKAYDYGVQLKSVLLKDGKINLKALVTELNGVVKVSGVNASDNVSFLTLIDGALFTNQRARFTFALNNAKQALSKIKTDHTDFYPSLSESKLNDVLVTVDEAILSMNGEMVSFSQFPHAGDFTVNLKALFDTPPNAKNMDIASGYPFVLEGDVVKPVESYFKTLLTGIVDIQ
ncbi:hypothetical protein K1X76_09950 [bacterium]|nr:hypothetical protein [bacterium]